MTRSDWLAAIIGGGLLGVIVLVAIVLHVRSPDPPEDLRRAFSTPVTIPDGMVTVSIDIGAALERADVDWFATGGSELEFQEEDIVGRSGAIRVGRSEGPAVLGGQARLTTHRGFDQHVVAVRFDDTWGSVSGPPPDIVVLDEEGYEVERGGLGVGCSKDEQGRIGPGETSIEVVVDPYEVGVLTYVLGPAEFASPC